MWFSPNWYCHQPALLTVAEGVDQAPSVCATPHQRLALEIRRGFYPQNGWSHGMSVACLREPEAHTPRWSLGLPLPQPHWKQQTFIKHLLYADPLPGPLHTG